jgi:carboxyl-terminal processing protease
MHRLLPSVIACALAALSPAAPAEPRHLESFDEIHQLVIDQFSDPGLHGLDWESIGVEFRARATGAADDETFAAVVNEMLALLQTSHTHFYISPEPDYYEVLDIFRGPHAGFIAEQFEGGQVKAPLSGARFAQFDGRWHVTDVVAGSEADERGLRVGDALRWDAESSFSPARLQAALFDGPVVLSVRSTASDAERKVTLAPTPVAPHELHRESIRRSARVVERAGAALGYVRVYSWAGIEMQDALRETLASDPIASADGLVLDIRGGWGGAQASYLDLFNSDVPQFEMRLRGREPFVSTDRWRKPVVLLVDEGCRSGKEIFALGFRDGEIGPVVGARTGGDVAAGQVFTLQDGSLLYLAVGEVFVNGMRLEGVGVEPNIAVERVIPFENGADAQLEAALQALFSEIRDS